MQRRLRGSLNSRLIGSTMGVLQRDKSESRVKREGSIGTELCPRVSGLQSYVAVSINMRGILGGRSIPRGKWPVAEGLQASEYSRWQFQRLSLQEWRQYSLQYSAQRWSHHSNWSLDSLRKTKKTKENPAVTVLLPSYSKWAIFHEILGLSLITWYVFYALLWIICGFVRSDLNLTHLRFLGVRVLFTS